MKKLVLSLLSLSLFITFAAHAGYEYDPEKCFKFRTKDSTWGVKYTYYPNMTAFTNDMSNGMTQGTTMASDPDVWTKTSISYGHFTSSDGECKVFAMMNQAQLEREKYIAFNLDALKQDIAMGYGEHLNVLAHYSACEDSAVTSFANALQKNYTQLEGINSYHPSFAQTVDRIIEAEGLKSSCLNYM